MNATQDTTVARPPVITIMGHIDHGKSTLLDYIRKTESVAAEAGGITQHLGAYEVEHTYTDSDGIEKTKRMTFLDTPGHEAFSALRSRGADVADVAVLIVAADDGVKTQTKEALESIANAGVPYVVAINKTDVSGADVERVKQELAEIGVYLEGYGGEITWAPISAKNGTGVGELLDLLILTTDLEELTADTSAPAEGVVIEADVDTKRGVSATLLIKNGTLHKGEFVIAGGSFAPVRIMEDDAGNAIEEASFSKPVRVVGFKGVPPVGSAFQTKKKKKEAEEAAAEASRATRESTLAAEQPTEAADTEQFNVPVVIKADVVNSLDALEHEIEKLENEYAAPRVVQRSVGQVTENDVRYAIGNEGTVIVAFNTNIEPRARELADESNVSVGAFNVIYELTEWLDETIEKARPRVTKEEQHGTLRVLKRFSKTKDKQVLGGRVEDGTLYTGDRIRVLRRGVEITSGSIINLQRNKESADHVDAGSECGLEVRAKIDIAPGDVIESFVLEEK